MLLPTYQQQFDQAVGVGSKREPVLRLREVYKATLEDRYKTLTVFLMLLWTITQDMGLFQRMGIVWRIVLLRYWWRPIRSSAGTPSCQCLWCRSANASPLCAGRMSKNRTWRSRTGHQKENLPCWFHTMIDISQEVSTLWFHCNKQQPVPRAVSLGHLHCNRNDTQYIH